MPCCTGSVVGSGSYAFPKPRHFGYVMARFNTRDAKQLRFSRNMGIYGHISLEDYPYLTRAMHIEDGGHLGNGFRIGIEDSLHGHSNFINDLVPSDRGENGLLMPAPRTRTNLLKVAVDVDEVLGSFLSSLNAFLAEKYLVNYDLSEYYVYDFMKIWNCTQAEANHRVHAFFESKHFNNGILPITGAYQSLSRLSSYCKLVVVTSRQHVIREPSLEWIAKHFKGIFSEVHFGNHFALEGIARPKSEICKSLGVELLIDDNPRYAVECAKEGIEVLLFDLDYSYPWSKTPEGPSHPLITRVCNWQEVERKLMSLRALHCELS
ncbi:hypothetical protein SUGI_0285170 [Cryptomeria japonica]|uniref:uncharacterized protein LOC131060117 n=1 Tax=Cryptomeria japonica TaxID=3369 RepID=UPI002408C28F|nr:uncharacterized protein LOC131060117 [Cryptomeria japonica]GLJ16620.1 hypothetical protein SUGI_0285170 [Cryptomeria japonica]